MSDKFNNIYRIESSRLGTWDYGWKGAYFITICTADKKQYFGKITDGIMKQSEIGKIAESEWARIREIRPDMNITLDAFCVMPDHIHGIITIGKNEYNGNFSNNTGDQRVGPQRKNLSSIVRGYKSAVTMYARKNDIEFKWQTRFYDHIIRDDESHYRIREYIQNNAANWNDDVK